MPKRAAKGAGMITQRADGRWEGRYTVGRDPGTGKQIRKSIYGKTQQDVRRRLTEITKDLDDGSYTDSQGFTVGRWMDVWLKEYTGNLKDTTQRSYRDHIRLHIKPGLGAVKLDKLSPLQIQRFYNQLLQSGRTFPEGRKPGENTPAGLSPKTVKNIHNVLHKALAQAAKPPNSLIRHNPSDAIELPRCEQKQMSVLTKDQITALLTATKNHWHYPIFYTTLFCGLRRGEVLGLVWDNINFDEGCIDVKLQLQRERKKDGQLRRVPLKNNKTRRIYPPPSVFTVLKDWQELQSMLQQRAGEKWQDNNAVFSNETGGFLEGSAIYRSLQHHLEGLGISGIRLHDLRHTFATTAISQDIDIKTIQETLGHQDPGFTLRVYGHSLDEMKRSAAQKMEAFASELEPQSENKE